MILYALALNDLNFDAEFLTLNEVLYLLHYLVCNKLLCTEDRHRERDQTIVMGSILQRL